MNEAQKISGTMFEIIPEQTGTGEKGNWVKQSFVIETSGQYPEKIAFTAWKDKCDLIPQTKGVQVTVSYNPKSREYNGKWYTDLNVWDIKVEGKEGKPKEKAEPVKSGLDLETNKDDELPF